MRSTLGACAKAYHETSTLSARRLLGPGINRAQPVQWRRKYSSQPPAADSFEGYTIDSLDAPLRSATPIPQPTGTTITPPPKTEKELQAERVRVVFGTRLAGPGQRKREIEQVSQMIAGISVPPKPEEPDNCCMSGCVNCVWDNYRDDIEEWAAKSAEARAALRKQKADTQQPGITGATTASMDDDGGGSETNWAEVAGGKQDGGDLFAGIPVEIREFMKTEKKLKERHLAEQARQQATTAS